MRGDAVYFESPPASIASRRRAALVGAVVVLAIVIAYFDTARSMVEIWRRSETFSHGFVVVPIALWLAWRKREELARLPLRPFWPAIALLASSGFVWLMGRLAGAAVVEQFGLVLMIQSAVLAVFGLAVARALIFPLAFVLFAVPFGEAFVPTLIDWTADFTVLALKLSGVPVYREGNNFVIPSGQWSVVEACSGIRYLIASLMAGTLFAYLMYASAWRRAAFIGAAIAVPIVANWLRAYLIVMLGHLSGNELATGVDHLIYGWIFFGIVLAAMFAVGARFRDVAIARPLPAGSARISGAAITMALIVAGIGVAWSPLASSLAAADADATRSLPPIEGAAGWLPGAPARSAWRPHFSGHRGELQQAFERGGDRVVVHIAYYAEQTQNRELVSSDNVLIVSKDAHWRELARANAELVWRGAPLRVRSASLAGAAGRLDVAWWYWIDGRVTVSDSVAKGLLAWSRLTRQPDDSAAVFLITEPSDRADGLQVLRRFAADMGDPIERALAAARDGARR